MSAATQPLRILFAGSGAFGVPVLSALIEQEHELVHIYSQPDRPAGRGRKLSPTPISALALAHHLPLTCTDNINTQTLPPADVLIVIAFGQKITPLVADHARLGAINLHASLLPKYRGAAPVNWAMINGETITGNSIIRMAQRMDSGAVLKQSQLAIGETETAGELHDRLADDGVRLVQQVLTELAHGCAIETPQDETLASLAPKLSRQSAGIDWAQPAGQISCRIRGMYPWPGCRVRLIDRQQNERGRITLVRAIAAAHRDKTGSAGSINQDGLVHCGAGSLLRLLEVQPEGKRPMLLAEYQRGHPWEAGMTLEPIG